MPKAVQELLLHLFRYGPNTTGIFRKSANARIAKEIKLELDEGEVHFLYDPLNIILRNHITKHKIGALYK